MKQLPVVFSAIIIFLISGCNPPPEKIMISGSAQGTYYAVTYFDTQGRNLQPEIDSLLREFDKTASMWVPTSLISRVNRGEPDLKINDWFIELFEMSNTIGENTSGAFDMTIGPLVNAWGFGFTDRQKLDERKVDSLRMLVDYRKVEISGDSVVMEIPGMMFDFNGIAQGYSVDLLVGFLVSRGINSCLVDIGGEVYARGRKPDGSLWTVGIERPTETALSEREIEAVVGLEDRAMATSGSYRKFYEENGIRYSHTIDPSTGYPVTHKLLSVTVVAGNCAIADGYATAFMVMGLQRSMKLLEDRDDLEAYFISSSDDGFEITYTKGMEKMLR